MSKKLEERVLELEKIVKTLQIVNEKSEIPNNNKTNKDGTPKKPKAKTGYLVFSSEKREEIKKLLETDTGTPPKPKEVISKLGEVWKSLSDEEKQIYNEKAKLMAENDI
tara:strand:- start:626 stop:952 length:327 start_codon:yes stop_codon:yes gene_type:complete